jgi:hypothetical protein
VEKGGRRREKGVQNEGYDEDVDEEEGTLIRTSPSTEEEAAFCG